MSARYALAAIALFALEVLIALYVHDAVIRPYLGDSVAVALVYLVLRAAFTVRVPVAAGLAFAIACALEIGQAFHLIDRLGLGHSRIVRVMLGTFYDPSDFLCYALGALGVLLVEWRIAAHRRR
uniref:ribosomal maturation YjgA family protein n=1 Tax=uncultured Sphingomonas sp. TaxID=158754 RepID=UPI0035CC2378